MSADNNMTVLMVSCDKYFDVAKLSIDLLLENWPDCKYKIIVSTEKKPHYNSRIHCILCGEGASWTQEVIKAIDMIDTPYVFLIVDDLFFCGKVDSKLINDILCTIIDNAIRYYNFPLHKKKNKRYVSIEGMDYLEMIPADIPYGVTIGKGIWDRVELMKVLGDGSKSAWEIENDFSQAAALNSDGGFINGYVQDRRAPLTFAHMISAGKWIPAGAKIMKECGYNNIDYSMRGFLSKKQLARIRIYSIGTKLVPGQYRRGIKMALEKIGFKFVTKW